MFSQMVLGKLFYIVLIVVPAVGCIVLSTYLIHRSTTIAQPSLTPLEELNKEFRNQWANKLAQIFGS